jgi:hypothetical protein
MMSTPSPSPTSHHKPPPSDVEKARTAYTGRPLLKRIKMVLPFLLLSGLFIVATMEVLHSRSSVRKTPPHKEDAIIFNDLQRKENFLKQAFHRSEFQQLLPERTFVSGYCTGQ